MLADTRDGGCDQELGKACLAGCTNCGYSETLDRASVDIAGAQLAAVTPSPGLNLHHKLAAWLLPNMSVQSAAVLLLYQHDTV